MADCLVLDTGALIALERKNRIVASALRVAYDKHYRILIPAVAYTEWVRGAAQGLGKRIEEIALLVGNERAVSRMAGEALRTLELDGREHLADATVAAVAPHVIRWPERDLAPNCLRAIGLRQGPTPSTSATILAHPSGAKSDRVQRRRSVDAWPAYNRQRARMARKPGTLCALAS